MSKPEERPGRAPGDERSASLPAPAPPSTPANASSRREFLRRSGLLAAAAVVTPAALIERGWALSAAGLAPDLLLDTFNGLAAFVVPGPDPYSLHQGESTVEPGALEAGTPGAAIFALNTIQLAPPPFPTFSDLVAFVLNSIAGAVHPGAPGPFLSPFARLSFQEKLVVFSVLEADPLLAPLGGALPVFVAFTTYSEVGTFDPATRTLNGQPVGWTISNYSGVSDGRNDLKGYYQNRRKANE